MENELGEPPAPQQPEPRSSLGSTIGPVIMAVLIVKLFGVAGGLATFGIYYGLKPKLGAWGAAAVACVLGVVIALALGAMLRAH